MTASRKALREAGEALRGRLFGGAPQPNLPAEFSQLVAETTYGAIWSRPGLGLADRMVCTLAALCAVRELPQLRRYVGAALGLDLPREAPFAVFAQVGIYNGLAAAESAILAAAEVYRERGLPVPESRGRDESMEVLTKRGEEVMQKLHGARADKGYAAPQNAFTSRLYPMTIPYGYGEIWQFPGLTLRQHALVSVSAFAALHLQDQLKKFGQSALNVGLTVDEVCEGIIQTAPYSGYAPALNALRWLSEVL